MREGGAGRSKEVLYIIVPHPNPSREEGRSVILHGANARFLYMKSSRSEMTLHIMNAFRTPHFRFT